MVRWTRNVKVKDRVPSKELRERLGIDDKILTLQQNMLRWYGHVLRKEDTDWVEKCMEYKVEGSRPRGRPKRTCREVVQKDCQARSLKKEDAMDRGRWKKLIKIGDDQDGGWVSVSSGTVSPAQRAIKRLLLLYSRLVWFLQQQNYLEITAAGFLHNTLPVGQLAVTKYRQTENIYSKRLNKNQPITASSKRTGKTDNGWLAG